MSRCKKWNPATWITTRACAIRIIFTHLLFRDDYKYVTPILKREAIDKEYLKSFEDLQKLLKRLQKTLSDTEAERNFVYLLPSVLCGIIVPAEVEEAIRDGNLGKIMVYTDQSKC